MQEAICLNLSYIIKYIKKEKKNCKSLDSRALITIFVHKAFLCAPFQKI